MSWLLSLDTELFRWINRDLANPVGDVVMPWLAGNPVFFPLVLLAALVLIWKGGVRAVVCLVFVGTVVALGEGLVSGTLKEAIGRHRPFLDLPDVRCLVGRGGSGSMPSSHAANWFAATTVFFIYYRRSLWMLLPLALAVCFSRVYVGVHYPSDVIVGAILGAGYGAVGVWSADRLWRWIGSRWFPLWWQRLPSLMDPPRRLSSEEEEANYAPRHAPFTAAVPQTSLDEHWVRLGYLVIAILLLARWFYLASDTIQLSEDEAYQWLWSMHPALSYYSKPPLIAYNHWLWTHVLGNTAFAIRCFSPVIAALLGWMVLRFFAREVNARAGFFLLLIVTATPLMAAGSILMTVDPLSVLCWTAAMLAGWRAVQENSRLTDWIAVGVWMGLGFLSKYTALFQILCFAVFFVLWKPARRQLARPGPYLALLINAALTAPVLVWNSQRDWITVTHVASNAGADKVWTPTLAYAAEFLGAEMGLLNPVFFVATVWAGIRMWKQARNHPKLVYFFSMGAPLFLVYFLYSFRSRIFPNWIAPSVLPLFCMMVIFWDLRWRLGAARIKGWLVTGLVFGLAVGLLFHDTSLVEKLFKRNLPVAIDPLRRVREWDQLARVVGEVRKELLAEGKPVFLIGSHYGIVSLTTFYLPEAREGLPEKPLAYYQSAPTPENQFFFLPGYAQRQGENAVYFTELDVRNPAPQQPPARLLSEFDSVTEAGVRYVFYHGEPIRALQFFLCRNLR